MKMRTIVATEKRRRVANTQHWKTKTQREEMGEGGIEVEQNLGDRDR
jgi:hypothetical protein